MVTGGTGALGRVIAEGLIAAGHRVAVVARDAEAVQVTSAQIGAMGVAADVLEPGALQVVRDEVVDRWGGIDVLVNAAGGNRPDATVAPEGTFFDLDPDALRQVVDLNLFGTLLPIQMLVPAMNGTGSIVNLSSMAATRTLSRVVGYGAAKAAVENATRWLADHLARTVGPGIRVNALAPGFFVGDQNRPLLIGAGGEPTERGRRIIEATPMGRFGRPEDLVGPVLWLASPASAFVTGAVIPVDGGFSAGSFV